MAITPPPPAPKEEAVETEAAKHASRRASRGVWSKPTFEVYDDLLALAIRAGPNSDPFQENASYYPPSA